MFIYIIAVCPTPGRFEVVVFNVVDPLVVEWEKESLSGNAGISFNLPGIKLFADYTIQEYNTLTIGASIGIR